MLTLLELLQLYRLPLLMDPILRDLNPEWGLPFEDAPALDLCVLIFRQFWGGCGGLVLSPVSDKTPNCGGVKVEIGDVGEESVEVEENWDLDKMEENLEESVDEVMDRAHEPTKSKGLTTGAIHPT